ncbi:MAG: enoyl-CoA hydratase/isomerase family protein [Alphaproteobacteria bacterium]|nr:enoyl-CoA hydratase/isomerase family protein [Alphaproteobacteria bacterium]
MTDEPLILIDRDPDDAFATITMNRPDKMNALSLELLDALELAVREAERDPGIEALILTGAGRAFTTGFDLNGGDFEMGTEDWRQDMSDNCRRMRTLWGLELPIIAAVNGYALAGGLELMMCCDLAIAAEDALMGEPEVRHVSGPPSLMMPWTVPIRHVRWLMYTGDMIDGREAERINLVNRAVPADQLMDEARRLARKLARMPRPAIKFAKASINHYQETAGLTSSWLYNVEAIATLHASPEGRVWTRKLKEMPLRDFLDEREAPFRDLD